MNASQLFDLINAKISHERREEARGRQLTIGDALYALSKIENRRLPVYLDWPNEQATHGDFDSYRGYYEDLSIEPSEGEPPTVDEFESMLADTVGRTFTGYKGGDYTMASTTLLWVSPYGQSSGRAVSGVQLEGSRVTLRTTQID